MSSLDVVKPAVEGDHQTRGAPQMIRQPSPRAVLAVRAGKVAATAAVAGVALAITLGGAIASPRDASGSTGGSDPVVERVVSDARCTDAAGKAIVRTRGGQ